MHVPYWKQNPFLLHPVAVCNVSWNRKGTFTCFFWPASPIPTPLSSLECQTCPCSWYHICSLSRNEGTLKPHIHLCGRSAFFPFSCLNFKESRAPTKGWYSWSSLQPTSPGSSQIVKTDLWHSPFSKSWKYFLTLHLVLLKDQIPYFWSVLSFLH